MSNLDRPRSYTPPLTAGARLLRGFKRIGLVSAVSVAIIGVAGTGLWAYSQWSEIHGRYKQSLCVKRLQADQAPVTLYEYDKMKIDLAKSGCPGPMYAEIAPVALSYANPPPAILAGIAEPIAIGLPTAAALAALSYLFFWLIGWLCAGFTRD